MVINRVSAFAFPREHSLEEKRLWRNYVNRYTTYPTKRAAIDAAKDKPCADCHRRFPSYVMDLDHTRGKKVLAVSHMTRLYTLDEILAEIEKCEVVCANCHRERTHRRK